ncbi:hypothetical protein BDQ17DRAFT_454334 [Cyathus striatus]|nr:hypothetical protein BDQ17DRAFT_454334 [Cyathus striatus]
MTKAIKAVKVLMTKKMHTEPLRIYLAFAQNGYLDDAAKVTWNVLFQKPLHELYVSEMEGVSADLYCQLLEYRHRCISSIVEICSKYESNNSNSMDIDWWYVASLSGSLVPTPGSISLASPVAQRKLRSLQEECRKYYPSH